MKNLIFLHGALGNISIFNAIINELKTSFNCHVLNFNGHGNAPFHEEFSIEEFAKELDEFIIDSNLDDCIVFGHSMGGYVALYSSAMGNERISKIITLGTKFSWTKESAEKEAAFFNIEKLKEKVPAFVEQLKNNHGEDWEKLVNHVRELLLHLGNHPTLTKEVLNKIKIPVVLCLGEKDKMVSYEETKETQSYIPNSNLIILLSQPHMLEGVDVMVLKSLILEF
jgi:pimeloyl-ACP methyl ester carboxylesterase